MAPFPHSLGRSGPSVASRRIPTPGRTSDTAHLHSTVILYPQTQPLQHGHLFVARSKDQLAHPGNLADQLHLEA